MKLHNLPFPHTWTEVRAWVRPQETWRDMVQAASRFLFIFATHIFDSYNLHRSQHYENVLHILETYPAKLGHPGTPSF